jgi:intergrase/recombinase
MSQIHSPSTNPATAGDHKRIDVRKSVTARVKPEELATLNQRLKLYGLSSVNELIHEFIRGKFPQVTEDKQLSSLTSNNQTSGQKTLLERTGIEFFMLVDLDDLYNYYFKVLRLHPKTCRDLVSYFRRFKTDFFTQTAESFSTLTPRVRSKILDAFRKFGQYYLFKYNNDQCAELVARIVRRYNLNAGNSDHGRIYLVDDNYLEQKLKLLMTIKGELGLVIRFGLFSGLREDELVYVHQRQICENLAGCDCDKLHVLNKPNGTSVILIQWHRGHKKCYFAIVPTELWNAFRKLPCVQYRPQIVSAHAYIKSKDSALHFMWLRKAHYNAMCRTMKPHEANILAGRAKGVDAKHYAMYELDSISKLYCMAWKKLGVEINIDTLES